MQTLQKPKEINAIKNIALFEAILLISHPCIKNVVNAKREIVKVVQSQIFFVNNEKILIKGR